MAPAPRVEGRDAGPPRWMELEPGEAVQLRTGPSRNLYLAVVGPAFGILVLVSAWAILRQDLQVGRAVSFVLMVGSVGLVVWVHLMLERYDYVVTDRRVGVRAGVLGERVTTVPLEAVDEVRIRSPAWIRPFGLGHLVFLGGDGEETRASFEHVDHPRALLGRLAPVVGGEPVA